MTEDRQQIQTEPEQSVVILMTSGPRTPQRCASPFYIATLLAAMDAQVHMFFTMEALDLIKKDVADNLTAVDGGKSITEFIRQALHSGVKMHVCQPALPGFNIERAELIEGIDVDSGGVLAELILCSEKVLTF